MMVARLYHLVKVHHSLGELKHLVEVNLWGCENLEDLPTKLETNSLIKLDLSLCEKVEVLPKFGEGMTRLSYLDMAVTSVTVLPESFGSLSGLRYLDLSCNKILNPYKFLKTQITPQISGFLTELYLCSCGLNDGSISDGFGSLSSLIALALSDNDFVNLPPGCFSSLSRLLFLDLNGCTKLKSLPRLPPQLMQLNAWGCDSMELLSSDEQLWNLVASLDHEYLGRTKYVISDEEDDVIPLECNHVESAKCVSPMDFRAIIEGHEIPTWFPNIEYHRLDEINGGKFVIKVNISGDLPDSEWAGIVVCYHISGLETSGDDVTFPCGLCIWVLELNEETCRQHKRAGNNSLHIELSCQYDSCEFEIVRYGWRVICKEDIQAFQLTQPQVASPYELKLIPKRVLDRFGKVNETLLIQT